MKTVALSFDVDCMDYLADKPLDEWAECFESFRKVFEEFPELRSTWFARIDRDTERIFGAQDFAFIQHSKQMEWLKQNGHEVGFHFHSYVKENGKLVQNGDEVSVLEELEISLELAKRYEMTGTRMGWAYQTNATLKKIAGYGYGYDSSAMPRPKYPWMNNYSDWESTGEKPYFPSAVDFRMPGTDSLSILEIPMSMLHIPAPADTRVVLKYINPSFRHSVFVDAMQRYEREDIVLVLHPYEAFENEKSHPLIAFSFPEFHANMRWLVESGYGFSTLNEMAIRYKENLHKTSQ